MVTSLRVTRSTSTPGLTLVANIGDFMTFSVNFKEKLFWNPMIISRGMLYLFIKIGLS